MMYRTRNPVMNRIDHTQQFEMENTATYGGITLKSIYFVILTMIAASITFVFLLPMAETMPGLLIGLVIAGPLVAFICAMIATYRPGATAVAGSIYAVLQGLTIGVLCAIVDQYLPGVVFAALAATMGIFLLMLVLYATGAIRVGNFFRKFMISALLGVILFNLIIFIISLFSSPVYSLFYGTGTVALIVCIVMIIIASLMILMDLDHMSQIVNNKLDKKYEWLGAFGLLVTLIWLFMELLRLFMILAARRK